MTPTTAPEKFRRALLGLAGLAAVVAGGVVLAEEGVISAADLTIEIRQTPAANVITVTEVERSASGVLPRGPSRTYTEARP